MGGGWLTQSAPTNHHQFYKRKILAPTERPEDYREVTQAERTVLEAADAKWQEPPQLLVKQWDTACRACSQTYNKEVVFGSYNPETGFFELNGLTDITTEEAIEILNAGAPKYASPGVGYFDNNSRARTNLPASLINGRLELRDAFSRSSKIEVINGRFLTFSGASAYYCLNLQRIIGWPVWTYGDSSFWNAKRLTTLELAVKNTSAATLYLGDSAMLTLSSLEGIIAKAANTAALTIRLHPDTFARLTPEVIAAAAAKNITFATT